MKKYVIPVSYTVGGYVSVMAESAEEALETAKNSVEKLPLLEHPTYVEDSYQIDAEDAKEIERCTQYVSKKHVVQSNAISQQGQQEFLAEISAAAARLANKPDKELMLFTADVLRRKGVSEFAVCTYAVCERLAEDKAKVQNIPYSQFVKLLDSAKTFLIPSIRAFGVQVGKGVEGNQRLLADIRNDFVAALALIGVDCIKPA